MNCFMVIDSPFVSDPIHEVRSKVKKAIKSNKPIKLASSASFHHLVIDRYYSYIIHKSLKAADSQTYSHGPNIKSPLLMIEGPKSKMDLDESQIDPSPKRAFPALKRKVEIELRPVKMIKLYNGYFIH